MWAIILGLSSADEEQRLTGGTSQQYFGSNCGLLRPIKCESPSAAV